MFSFQLPYSQVELTQRNFCLAEALSSNYGAVLRLRQAEVIQRSRPDSLHVNGDAFLVRGGIGLAHSVNDHNSAVAAASNVILRDDVEAAGR